MDVRHGLVSSPQEACEVLYTGHERVIAREMRAQDVYPRSLFDYIHHQIKQMDSGKIDYLNPPAQTRNNPYEQFLAQHTTNDLLTKSEITQQTGMTPAILAKIKQNTFDFLNT